MKGRLGFLLGCGAGYVLGAKAGHERYNQLMRLYENVLASPRVKEASAKAKDAMGTGIGQAGVVASEGRTKVSSAVRGRRAGASGNLAVAPPPGS